MNVLAQVIEALSLEMDFEKVCTRATRIAMEMVGADVSALALPTDGDLLAYRYFWGLPDDADIESMSRPVGLGAARHVFASGQPVYVPDYPKYQYAFPPFIELGLMAGLAVPVMIGSQVAGVLSLGWLGTTGPPSEEQVKLIEVVARQVGTAFHRQHLMRELSDSQARTSALNDQLNRIIAVSPAIIYSLTLDVSGPEPRPFDMLLGDNAVRMLGYPQDMLAGHPECWYELVHPDDLRRVMLLSNPRAFEAGHHERTYRLRHSTGHYIWVQENLRLFPKGKDLYEIVGVIMDITERKEAEAEVHRHRDHLQELVAEQTQSLRGAKNAAEQALREAMHAEEQLRHLAHNDALTGLANRVLTADRLEHLVAYARQSQRQLAVLFIDLDRFKNVNDSLGHSLGDRLLQEVARRLCDGVRHADTIGRQSGDEFIVLLSGIDHVEDVASIAEGLVASIARPYQIDGHELAVTLSMGISLYPNDGETPEELITKADTAMYKAKEVGRNNYQFFTQSMGEMARDRLLLENQLRRAIELQEFEVYYQPLVKIATGVVFGVEALVRWHHPERGLLLPQDFIPVAEESGLVIPIGSWVLREACRQGRAWQDSGLPAMKMSVNISPLQFRRQGLLQEIEQVLEDTGFAPHDLNLELTESVVMHRAEATIDSLRALKQKGIGLCIDDFGTGYSSLGYLKSFPIDSLKIDRTFFTDLKENSSDAAIVRAIVGMGHSLGLTVLAEGVSNEQQLAYLHELGCHEYQGHFFSAPLEAGSIARLLGRQKAALAKAAEPLESQSSSSSPEINRV